MQDIINKIDERVSGLLAFERHDLVSPNLVLAGLLALHEDMALALHRIDFWQHTLEAWLKTSSQSGTAGTDQDNRPALASARALEPASKQ